MANQFTDPVEFVGKVVFSGGISGITRAKLDEQSAQKYSVPWTSWRTHDALHTNLGTTGAGDDLGLAGNTFGTDSWYLTTQDLKTAGATQEYARTSFMLPSEYIAGEDVTVRVHCGMVTTVADTSATIDVEIHKFDRDGTVSGGDLVSTAATSCNSLTFADKDFTVTPTNLTPGDHLDVRTSFTVTDSASGTAVIARAGAVEFLLDVKG